MDNTYSHDSQYPDKWDKPIITLGDEPMNYRVNDVDYTVNDTFKAPEAQVITNNIKNDKDRYIPPLHIITRDSGYIYNSNYGYLDFSNMDNINPDILDNYYYSSQRTNIIKDLKDGMVGDRGVGVGGVKEARRIIDSIKGSGRVIPSNKDASQYSNNINGEENKVVCVGCSCCGGVTDTGYDIPTSKIINPVKKNSNQIKKDSGRVKKDSDTVKKDSGPVIPQLEPRYTSVVIPTNGYTWSSTPMPNTDNYYVDLIKRPYSPILFSQNGKQLGYRYEQIKTGQHEQIKTGQHEQIKTGQHEQIKTGQHEQDANEPFIPISPENKIKYNYINKYIFIITIIFIVFLVVKYHIPPFV
jgi:hypothetical protein